MRPICKNKLLAPIGAAFLATVLGTGVAAGMDRGGVDVAKVMSWPALSVQDLMQRTGTSLTLAQVATVNHAGATPSTVALGAAAAVKSAPSVARQPQHRAGTVSVDELLASAPMTVGAWVAYVTAGGEAARAGAPAGVPMTLPTTTKKAAAAPVIVQVTIPDAPDAAPLAQKVTAAPSVAAERPVAAPVAAPRADDAPLTLDIRAEGGGLAFTPQSLALPRVGATAVLHVDGQNLAGLEFFVRDQRIAELTKVGGGTKDAKQIRARQPGVTELYAVMKGRMYIVPIAVAADSGAKASGNFADLQVPGALVSLEGVFQGSMQSALYPGLEQASNLPTPSANVAAQAQVSGSGGLVAPSLQDSVAETTRTMLRQAHETERFYTEGTPLNYKAVTIQVIDDRSVPAQGRIYPVANARVHLVGTEFSAETDATGHLTIRDVPLRSRFLVRIDDPTGQVRPALAELTTKDDGSVSRLRVMRSFAFDTYSSIAGIVQNAALGSYCATVVDRHANGAPVAAAAAQADVAGDGPFYFNDFGFLDRALPYTGSDGRICFFNLAPGPVSLTIYEQGAPAATLSVTAFAGRHVEDTIDVGHEATLTTRLATMATAREQLSSDLKAAVSLTPIDMIDLIPLGTESPLMQLEPSHVTSSDPVPAPGGRLRAFAQAAEFEPAVYTYPEGDANTVTPLIPRGFVEDMSLFAQVSHDPELGTVVAEYATPAGAGQESIAMRLVDLYGHDVGDGWYYGDSPLTKTIFFNVPAGTYALLAETKDGYWLGSETVTVYNETVSYSRMGSALRYRP